MYNKSIKKAQGIRYDIMGKAICEYIFDMTRDLQIPAAQLGPWRTACDYKY